MTCFIFISIEVYQPGFQGVGEKTRFFQKSLDQVSNELKMNHHHAYFVKETGKGGKCSA